MSARFSEAEAAQIDQARGGLDRSPWLRSVALAAIGQPDPQTETSSQPEPVNAEPGRCPHRLNPGAYCKTCGKNKTRPDR